MLTLTPTAADAVRTLVADMDIDDDTGGLRITSGSGAKTEAGQALELALVNGPEATDDQIDAGGAHVFLEPTVTEYLENKVLDANIDRGRVQFLVLQRGPLEEGMNGGPPA